jgi:hypothetical protein
MCRRCRAGRRHLPEVDPRASETLREMREVLAEIGGQPRGDDHLEWITDDRVRFQGRLYDPSYLPRRIIARLAPERRERLERLVAAREGQPRRPGVIPVTDQGAPPREREEWPAEPDPAPEPATTSTSTSTPD